MNIATGNRLRRLARDRRGVAALEFTIIATLMLTMMLAAFDFGNAAQQQVQLQQVVRAGGAYAARYPTDASGIQGAVTAALPAGWTLTAPPSVTCGCLPAGGGLSTTSCA